jgi:hypothetical protein
MYFFFYVYVLMGFLLRLIVNYRRVEQEGASLMKSIEKKFDGVFSEKMAKEAIKRQGIQQLYINDSFAQLHGRHTNTSEQRSNRMYFVLSGLYDDLIDQKEATVDEIDKMFLLPETYRPRNFNERVLIYAHLDLMNSVQHKPSYQQLLSDMHKVQMESLSQFNPALEQDNLLSITFKKGGYSLLMCRHYLDLPVWSSTDAIWYQLGVVIQLSNDIFDIYKDLQQGIQTFANRARSAEEVQLLYHQQVSLLRKQIGSLPVGPMVKLRFSIALSLIPALGCVAVDNLVRLQRKYKRFPLLKELPRKELIVDMERPKNLFRLLGHSFRLGRLLA